MARVIVPPLFRSKLLCFSLLYLTITVVLTFYTSISTSRCLSEGSPIQFPLFRYPLHYDEHKHALPTFHSSCTYPIYFPDYWDTLKEIQNLCKNSSLYNEPVLSYMRVNSTSFGGNFSMEERLSYFNQSNHLPCGFMKKFPISKSDQTEMRECLEVVVVSAIFNDLGKIRQPGGLGSETIKRVCFFMFVDEATLQNLFRRNLISRKSQEYRIGVWRIVKVGCKDLYDNVAMNRAIPKFLVHRLFPNSKYSMWIDSRLKLTVDPLLLIHSLVISENVDIAIAKHPHYTHTMEEAMAIARWKVWWNVDVIRTQVETYCENGLKPWSVAKRPYVSDVPNSGMILRRHGHGSDLFSCLIFNELEAFGPRDQIPFAFVRDRMNPKIAVNMFKAEVFEQVVIEYREGPDFDPKTKTIRAIPSHHHTPSKCDNYLLEMWG